MRIAISLDENKQDIGIVLARAPYFLLREDGMDTIVENPPPRPRAAQESKRRNFWWIRE